MNAPAGLTLVELLVGLVIMGAALGAGYGAFAGLTDHRQRAVLAMDEAAREALVRQVLMEWLRGARLNGEENGPPFMGLDGFDGDVPDDEISFLTTAPTLPGAGDGFVRIFVDRDPMTKERGLVAEMSEWRGSRVERLELVPAALGMNARYLYGFRARRWLSSWISSSEIPLGVEIRLQAAPGDSLPRLLRRPLRVVTGADR